jgi:DNA polymerase III epsilon subunit-like protein
MEIIVVDIETGVIEPTLNNYDIDNCLICEIGIVNLNLETGESRVIYDRTCQERPGAHPSSWVFKNTSLTLKEVTDSQHFHDLKPTIQELLDDSKPVTSWNHDFDFAILESRGLKIPIKFWDPKTTLKHFLEIHHPSGQGYKWPSVQEAYKYFNPDKIYQQTHRAIQDAKIEAEIIYQAVLKWPVLKNQWEDYI